MAVEKWSLDDRGDRSPGDYLIGCVTEKWEGDPESMFEAAVAFLSAVFAQAGMETEAAIDAAAAQAERITSIGWDGTTLSFQMDDDGEGGD